MWIVTRSTAINPRNSLGTGSKERCPWRELRLWGLRASTRVGERGHLQAATERQFLQNIVHVTLDRVDGDVEPGGDLLVAQTLAEEVNHLALAVGQADSLQQPSPVPPGDIRDDLREQRVGQGL